MRSKQRRPEKNHIAERLSVPSNQMIPGAEAWSRGILLATTGFLVATDIAHATTVEVTLSGKTEFGMATAGNDLLSEGTGDRGYTFFMDSEINLKADFSGPEGLSYGAEVELEADADQENTVNADETFLFVTHAFGRIELGRTDGAEDAMALGADTIAAGTGGIDGDTANLGETEITGSSDAAKITYFTPRIAGVQLGASFIPDTGDDETGNDQGEDLENHIGLGVNFIEEVDWLIEGIDDVEVGLALVGSFGGSEQSGVDDLAAVAFGGTLGVDDLTFGASYGSNDDRGTKFDFATLGVTYDFGPGEAGLGYNLVDDNEDGVTHILALSGDVDILSGVVLKGDISYSNPDNTKSTFASVLSVQLNY